MPAPLPPPVHAANDRREQPRDRPRQRDRDEHGDDREHRLAERLRQRLERGLVEQHPRALECRPRERDTPDDDHAEPAGEPRCAASVLDEPELIGLPRAPHAADHGARDEQHRQRDERDKARRGQPAEERVPGGAGGQGRAGLAIGGLLAGDLVARYGLRKTLVAFAARAGATHLLYAALAVAGHSWPLFACAVLADSLANAMVIAAFLSVLMSVTSAGVSATQFALLTLLSSVGQRVFGPLAATIVARAGWPALFATSAACAAPAIVLGWYAGACAQRSWSR